jgi:dolichol kinase
MEVRLPIKKGTVLRIGFFIAFLFLFIKPIRDRISFLKTIFLSWDRPEDRPHTLFWLSTQLIVGYAVLIPMDALFKQYGFANLVLIPVLVHGIGDGLAEPVGVRFGRHKYATRSLFSKRRYTRSIEGSACVLIDLQFCAANASGMQRPKYLSLDCTNRFVLHLTGK